MGMIEIKSLKSWHKMTMLHVQATVRNQPRFDTSCYRRQCPQFSLSSQTLTKSWTLLINPLKTKRVCFIQVLSAYRAVNTLRLIILN
jgi:hypothetical protein